MVSRQVKTRPMPAFVPGPRYAALARVLADEIDAGRFPVGSLMPTEAQLQVRFDVSRHTVREALRELKTRGLVTARAGIGTLVRASRSDGTRFVQGVSTVQELIQFFEATRMRTVARRVVIADQAMADRFSMKAGQEWHEASLLRYGPDSEKPVAAMSIFLRPEHADVLSQVDTSRRPVFSLIEHRHGVRLAEVRQQIVPVHIGRAAARLLESRAGQPALDIVRCYLDGHERVTMVSAGLYPADRFVHSTRFRIQPQ